MLPRWWAWRLGILQGVSVTSIVVAKFGNICRTGLGVVFRNFAILKFSLAGVIAVAVCKIYLVAVVVATVVVVVAVIIRGLFGRSVGRLENRRGR